LRAANSDRWVRTAAEISVNRQACDTGSLVRTPSLRLDAAAGLGGRMKPLQPRETSPLWVWLAFGLLGLGAIAYLAGYLLIEEMIVFFK
jgi:hypothetical protein